MPDFTEENEKLEDPVPSIDPESQFKAERDELYDRLLRKQAEFDNYKKRVEKERSEYLQFASAELIRELLNAMDSFDLAIHNASSDSASKEKKEKMIRGLDLIYKQFQDTLSRFGVKPIDARGQVFDPNL